jgi:hypothetical protein
MKTKSINMAEVLKINETKIMERDEKIEINGEMLEKINRFTRRALTAEEVYVFSVILCDNEIDRDYERFTINALQKLGQMYVGKTGIFDHNPKGKNQTARIFETSVEVDEQRMTQVGEPYHYLKAKAYMVKTQNNKDLILEIDAGIKKEVSVGCSMGSATCSICGADLKKEHCDHKRGEQYGNRICCVLLEDPKDAYEWSFVAVPAQVGAGVVKAFGATNAFLSVVSSSDRSVQELITTIKSADKKGMMISQTEASKIAGYIKNLDEEASFGRVYLNELRTEVIRLSYLSESQIPEEVIESVANKIGVQELNAFKKAFVQSIEKREGLPTQFGSPKPEEVCKNEKFKI